MTTYLLDANVLIALTFTDHEHHELASTWAAGGQQLAVCPIVEGALVRFLLRIGESAHSAKSLLDSLHATSRYAFWPDSLSFRDTNLEDVHGHRQVTDSYLASLAGSKGGMLATLDRALAVRHPAIVELVSGG